MQAQESQEPQQLSQELYIAQYESLRSEIEKRLDLRQGLLTFTLVLAGSVLSLATQPGIAAATAFYYPIVALFLAASWTHNDAKIGQISQYIKSEVEKHLQEPLVGWETYRRRIYDASHVLSPRSGLIGFSVKGVFLSTEILALLIGVVRSVTTLVADPQPGLVALTALLFLAGVCATAWSYCLLQHRR